MRANDFTTESAVEDLKNKLPSLKNTSYDTIDELMQKISRRYKLTGKKLHDLFVHKYGHTPDTWIKKIKNRLGEEDITESEHAHYRNYSTSDLLRMIKTIKRDEIGLKIITSITNEIMRRKQGMSEGPKEVIGLAKFAIGGGIPGGQSPADILGEKNVAEGLPQTLRKFVPGYAKREIDKKMDAEKFGRTDVDRDANYYRYKKIQDKIKEQGVAEGQLDELDIFAPVTTYVRLANGTYVAANWRRNQNLSTASNSASFIDIKPLAPAAAKQLGLDQRLNDPEKKYTGATTIASGGPIQASGPLADRTINVVDIRDPKAAKDSGVPDTLFGKIAQWAQQQGQKQPGVAEGLGDQGNFAGDTPVNIGSDTAKRLGVGDIVSYLGQKSKIVAQSKDRKYSRITIASDFGGTTKDVLTSDLKRLGQGVAEGLSEDVQGPDEVQQIKDFIKWSMKTLNVKTKPKFTLSKNTEQAQAGHHTGVHSGDRIWVYIGNRNLIDIFRTIFHELVHQRQQELNMIKDGDSYPGSPIEAMADMMAGKYIKIYGKEHPEIFQ